MCLQPLYLHRRSAITGRVTERVVPCGVCPECVKKRQSGLVVRALVECQKYSSFCFFTLTYNPSHLPHTDDGEQTLRREDLKNWKKEFRKLISNRDFAWICCGEYSPKSEHRPHYHGLIFGLNSDDLRIVENAWSSKYGFTMFKVVSAVKQDDVVRVARYVAKYVIKPNDFKVFSDTVEKPRIMSSVGFGYPDSRFWDYVLCKDKYDYNEFDFSTISSDIVFDVLDRMHYDYKGFHYSLPLYFLKKRLYVKSYVKNVDGTRASLPPSFKKSALLQMVSFVLRFRTQTLCNDKFKSFCASHPERTFIENVDAFNFCEERSNFEKFNLERENLISIYKKSVI